MKHILAVLEIDESIHENLAKEGYTKPRKIFGTTMKELEDAMANQSLNKADQGDIKNLKDWMNCYTTKGNKLPKTEEEWKKTFTDDEYDDYTHSKGSQYKPWKLQLQQFHN